MPKLSLRSRTRPCLSSGTNWPTRSSGYPDRRGAVSERLKKEAHREVGEEGAGTPPKLQKGHGGGRDNGALPS